MPDLNGNTLVSEPRKLILCFDGTGNEFSGSNADTNVVKLYNKLLRNDPYQYHYYQTGIGTYDVHETTVNKLFFGERRSRISKAIDQGFGTTFDAHVMAGYRFLMRYYEAGDIIYMFGFSRGAFTARFLARMISTVGLLCKGNEEMVPFAYRLYQRYLEGEVKGAAGVAPYRQAPLKTAEYGSESGSDEWSPMLGRRNGRGSRCEHGYGTWPSSSRGSRCEHGYGTWPSSSRGSDGASTPAEWPLEDDDDADDGDADDVEYELTAFSNTFCRKESVMRHGQLVDENVKVFFLGIWDCVNSVAVLERKAPVPMPVLGTAQYVRHAVAVDERRVKFKPALLAQDIQLADGDSECDEDIQEVWFPGNHGDVGGGWPADGGHPLDARAPMTPWQSIENFFCSRRPEQPSHGEKRDRFQLSDIALDWMIRETQRVGDKEPLAAVKWSSKARAFQKRLERDLRLKDKNRSQALTGFIHDCLSYGHGTGFVKVTFWKTLEWMPFLKHWELEGAKWKEVTGCNRGSTRDIPKDAVLHEALDWRLRHDDMYMPRNNHGDRQGPCLKVNRRVPRFAEVVTKVAHHHTYTFDNDDDDDNDLAY